MTDNAVVFGAATNVNFGNLTDEGAGRWQASFYDPAVDEDVAPGTIAGTFDARDDYSSLSGAFGAHKADE